MATDSIVLCEGTLFMAGMALNLQNESEFHIVKIKNKEKIAETLGTLKPLAILVDAADTAWDWEAVLGQTSIKTPVVVLNSQNHTVFIYSCHCDQVKTINDLENMIHKHCETIMKS